jgi:monoamine oxidase
VLRWHALSGYSLALTQYTGGRVTIARGTRSLVEAIADGAPMGRCLGTIVARVARATDGVEVETSEGELFAGRTAVAAVPVNTLGAIEFAPQLSETKQQAIALGQSSRGIKIFIRARGERVFQNSIRPSHPFGYLDTELLLDGGEQLMIGFGPDASCCDANDTAGVQSQMQQILPGYDVIEATAHDWFADPFSCGTWAIHRPGWYELYHADMQQREGQLILAGSDLANGWAGFIDGAIESGLRAGALAAALSA